MIQTANPSSDLFAVVVELLAQFREPWMAHRPEIVSISGFSWRRSHEFCESGVLPIDEGTLPESVMNSKTISRRRLQQRRVTEQRPHDQLSLPRIERDRSSAPAKICLYDKPSSLGIAPKGFTDTSRCFITRSLE